MCVPRSPQARARSPTAEKSKGPSPVSVTDVSVRFGPALEGAAGAGAHGDGHKVDALVALYTSHVMQAAAPHGRRHVCVRFRHEER